MKRTLTVILSLLLLIPAAGAQAQQATRKLNKKNLVVKEWNQDVNTNRKILDHETTYGPEGRKIEEIEYSGNAQKWRKRYEYNENGKLARELLYNEKNRLVSIKKYEYNEFGKKKIRYAYDAKGKPVSIKIYEYVTADAAD